MFTMEILGPVMEIIREEAQEWIEVIDGLLYDPQRIIVNKH